MECRDALRTYRMGRREALQVGSGLFGLTLFDWLRARHLQAENGDKPTKDVSCIFLFLAGGASHYETFDPKPEAGDDIRGIWAPTATSVPGTFVCEKMPMTARLMHKVALVRSWQGIDGRRRAVRGYRPVFPDDRDDGGRISRANCFGIARRPAAWLVWRCGNDLCIPLVNDPGHRGFVLGSL